MKRVLSFLLIFLNRNTFHLFFDSACQSFSYRASGLGSSLSQSIAPFNPALVLLRLRSTRPPTRNALWHKNRHRRLGRIRQKNQGIPENTSHGGPLEDSGCKTERSEIQTSSETRSKPPNPPHPMKSSHTNRASDNRAYQITYQTRQHTLTTIPVNIL